MNGIRWYGFQAKLVGLTALFLAGGVVMLVIHTHVVNTVKIDGAAYEQIAKQRQVVNELTPSTLYIRSSYMAALLMASETDPARMRAAVAEYRRTERDYRKQYDYWQATLADKTLSASLRDDTDPPATEFFAAMSGQFLPLAEATPPRLPEIGRAHV